MHDVSLLAMLSLATLVLVLCIGIYLFLRNRQSQIKRGEKPGGIAGPS